MEIEFDEQKAIDFIAARLPQSASKDGDEILNIIDIIFDYYDENGLCDIDVDDDDAELDIDDLMAYVKKMAAKDRDCPFSVQEIEAIVNAELDFEDSLMQ